MFFKNRNFKFMFVYVFLFVITFLVSGFFIANTVKADNPAVIISEFSPVSSTEWVELSNTTSSPIDLGANGYKLVDASNHVKTLSGTIPAYGLLVFEYSNWLNNTGGDSLTLLVGEVNTPVISASYGNVDPGSPTLHIAGIPLASESIIVNNDNLSIATTPTKGWFNNAGQDGQAPLLSTIDSALAAVGIVSNIGELTNPSATPVTEVAGALYFEKTGYGKIVFEKVLNMSDQNTVGVLQSLGTVMEMSAGHIKFDSTTATDMNATGAKIYMYGLSEFNSEPSLIVKNDTGTIIPPSDVDNYPTIVKSWDNNTKTLSFTTNHFTQFDIETQTTPTFSPVAGAVAWGTTVIISSSGADAIYYTTNGDTPTTSSTNQASTPLIINEEVTVKALAVKTGLLNSIIGSATYTEATSDNLIDVVLSETPGNYIFSGGTYTYNSVTVANSASSITVTPTGAGVITMSLDGGSATTLTSSVASSSIPLVAGTEKIITVVTTETGKLDKTYTIKVTRALSSHRTSGSYIMPLMALTPIVNTNPAIGQVLGAEKFNFTKFLKFKALSYKVSLQGTEVIELQKFLTSLGYDCGIADGKFGPKTKGAVIKFQKANKLVGDGIVGAKTRAVLNK